MYRFLCLFRRNNPKELFFVMFIPSLIDRVITQAITRRIPIVATIIALKDSTHGASKEGVSSGVYNYRPNTQCIRQGCRYPTNPTISTLIDRKSVV